MDDFTMYGDSFDKCLENLSLVLKRCIETNIVLNYEKCYFMVKQGIVLGHVVSSRGLEVDKAKIDVISSLPYPSCMRGFVLFLAIQVSIDALSKISRRLQHPCANY
jgi:hypothetical protein